ncbi:hypothetical protein QF026_008341 [Streptomyces aurantiacus]|nr:hypothetical protein [Streptomyces aurantiacus]
MPDSSRAAGLHDVDARVRHHRQGRHVQHPGRGAVFDTEDVGVFLGLDVGKTTHHGHGLTPAGKKVLGKQLPHSEPKLRAVFDELTAKFGTVLVIVDQPASVGALPLTVARDAGCKVVCLPGPAMRRIADLYPGEVKSDAKDAAVIADAARTMPHTLCSLEPTDEITAELAVLVGFDQDLAAEATRTSNRIRGLFTQFHSSLERVLGTRLDHPAVTWRLDRHGSPAALRKAGRRKLVELTRPKAPRMATRLIDDVFDALDEQTVVVPGTGTLDVVIPSLARSLAAVHEQRVFIRLVASPTGAPPSRMVSVPRSPALREARHCARLPSVRAPSWGPRRGSAPSLSGCTRREVALRRVRGGRPGRWRADDAGCRSGPCR